MFERYTEKARRVIFFARYEASQFGSPFIETEHLLLGLLREDRALAYRFLGSDASVVESIRKQIEGRTTIREKVSTSVDLPLSYECKRVLSYGAEEAERLGDKHIGTEHLLLGLLREEKSFAAELLHDRGLRISTIREVVGCAPIYRCRTCHHEGVWAIKIRRVEVMADGTGVLHADQDDSVDKSLHQSVTADWLKQHNPQPGGYYVVSSSAGKQHAFYMPAELFEVGFERIER
jgi:hypothetical protein